jgi:hypothetical protein
VAPSATFFAQPDAAALLARAEYETGLRDFGDGQFRGPLETPRCRRSPTRNIRPSNHTS